MNIDYTSADFPVREDIGHAHTRFWQRLARAGKWWTSSQRIAIAAEARAAWRCDFCRQRRQALSAGTVIGQHTSSPAADQLPAAAIEAIHRITTDASRLSEQWYREQLDQGLSEGQYIELVGTIVSIISIDSFCYAIGVTENPLPVPGEGTPDHYIPEKAGADDAWVPMIAEDNSNCPEHDLWTANQTGNVVRALSYVPDEVRTLKDLSAAHYLKMSDVRNSACNGDRSITRSQMELVAGRTSALNACYY